MNHRIETLTYIVYHNSLRSLQHIPSLSKHGSLSIYLWPHRMSLEPRSKHKLTKWKVLNSRPLLQAWFCRVNSLAHSAQSNPSFKAPTVFQFLIETSLGDGLQLPYDFYNAFSVHAWVTVQRTQMKNNCSPKDYSSPLSMTIHARHCGFSFSSAKEACTGLLLKSHIYKWQAGCHCINTGTCSLYRWSFQKHESLTSRLNTHGSQL